MTITTKTGLVGFLLALSLVSVSKADAKVNPATDETISPTIEQRLTRISEAIKEQEMQTEGSSSSESISGKLLATWINTSRGGFVNRPNWRNGGGFINHPNWRNGGFLNRPNWRNGGGFLNRRY